MSNLDPELEALKQNLVDMLILVNSQLSKCKEATMNSDADLANQVLSTEKRVNALDLAISGQGFFTLKFKTEWGIAIININIWTIVCFRI